MEQRIRVQALALVRSGDRILVEMGRDEVKDETFFRALGGTVEFGETGAETVRREFLEELGTGLERLYAVDEWDAHEETARGVVVHPVSWRAIDSFGAAGDTLYPEELRGFL